MSDEYTVAKILGSVIGIAVLVGLYYIFLKSFKKVFVAILIQSVLSPFLMILLLPLAMANDSGAAPTSWMIFIAIFSILVLLAVFGIPIFLTNLIFGNPTSSVNNAAKQIGGFLKAIRRA